MIKDRRVEKLRKSANISHTGIPYGTIKIHGSTVTKKAFNRGTKKLFSRKPDKYGSRLDLQSNPPFANQQIRRSIQKYAKYMFCQSVAGFREDSDETARNGKQTVGDRCPVDPLDLWLPGEQEGSEFAALDTEQFEATNTFLPIRALWDPIINLSHFKWKGKSIQSMARYPIDPLTPLRDYWPIFVGIDVVRIPRKIPPRRGGLLAAWMWMQFRHSGGIRNSLISAVR